MHSTFKFKKNFCVAFFFQFRTSVFQSTPVFLLAALIRRGGLGGGDIKLAALIGLVVGFPEVLWALAAGIVAGGIAALILVFLARWEIKSHIPYAPFLCLGAIIALLYNPLPLFLPSR